ncbi:hypothetical protein RvY_04954-2 [Ramazzottius varieornatus]|uniref:ABC transmembrane type-1 domain-containing protein n=1 Tax=Ramazzottius varieornatus TaxID=947166 RepID=A0A1D1V2I5_RAMVA|nr:hypothetical protein RvY_04954-2 [Ramazzottius varieornatus]
MANKFGFNALLFARFKLLLPALFPRPCGRTSLLFLLLFTLAVLGEFIAYQVGIVPSKFYAVLGEKDKQGFYATFLEASLYILATAIVLSAKQYVGSFLNISWRKLVTRKLHRLYFMDKAYYFLNVLDKSVDNPDQRITQDVDKMCDKLGTIAATLIIAPFRIAYYSYKSFITTTYIGPLGIFGYFIIGTIATKLLMSPVINYVVKQEKREGDFRFKHVQIRTNAESLAFYDCGHLEERRLNSRLSKLLSVELNLTNFQLPLNCMLFTCRVLCVNRFSSRCFGGTSLTFCVIAVFINFYTYFGGILSHLILSIPIFAGYYDALSPADLGALISANAFVSIYLIYSFTSLVDLSKEATAIAGTAHRVGELLEYLKSLSALSNRDQKITVRTDGENFASDFLFQLDGVTLTPPAHPHQVLIRDLTLTISRNHSIMISGPSSSGKTSLLRLIAGLWYTNSGRVDRHFLPPVLPSDIVFLPQKPYFTDGSLWQQIAFPLEVTSEFEDEEAAKVKRAVELAGCEKFLDRAGFGDSNVGRDWSDVLSPGEMQRLMFARLFYHKPTVACE